MIRRLISGIFGLFVLASAAAQQKTLHPVEENSSVSFSIKNFGFAVNGNFHGLDGEMQFDPARPTAAKFDVSISAASINTGNNTRDKHLRSDDYLDVSKFPRVSITSETVKAGKNPDTYILVAKLQLHGQSGTIEIPFTVKPSGGGWLFEGSFTVNRIDYKVGGNSLSMADNATVNLKILGK
ncbi:YceI family protein [Flavihumibacter petaseus]|uniref:YceI family protein n=1 Tax=Flavihumibacter petaseus NBRC 106054 TaxID=1220578 RepID=A0A0E9N3N9_9BACT|nr:YceI family protein [Flavihumibacter petaseus]GAO44393.1 YceI family protein [Flavihumibacter petaseus NBRC 106054]